MKEYKVIFKRTQVYYSTVVIKAQNSDEAHSRAITLLNAGLVKFDVTKIDFVSEDIFTISG